MGDLERREQPVERAVQAPPVGQGYQPLRLAGAAGQAVVELGHRQVPNGPGHRGRDLEVVPGGLQLGARPSGEPALHAAVQRRQDGLDRAEAGHERCCGLGSDPLDAGQSVAGVASQDGELGVPGAGDVVLRGDRAHGVRRQLLDRVEHPDRTVVANELEQVAIAGHDVDGAGLPGAERPEHVVGLVAVDPEDGQTDRVEHLEEYGDLRRQRRRLGLGPLLGEPVGLVGRDGRHPERWAPVVVQAGDEPGRPRVAHDPRDQVDRAADRVDRRAVGRGDRLRHAVEGAVPQGRGIEERQLSGHSGTLSPARPPSAQGTGVQLHVPVPTTLRPW